MILVILGVTFDFQMSFEKHLCSGTGAAFQRIGILRKSLQVFHDRLFLGDVSGFLSCTFWSTVLQCGARLPIHTLIKLLDRV